MSHVFEKPCMHWKNLGMISKMYCSLVMGRQFLMLNLTKPQDKRNQAASCTHSSYPFTVLKGFWMNLHLHLHFLIHFEFFLIFVWLILLFHNVFQYGSPPLPTVAVGWIYHYCWTVTVLNKQREGDCYMSFAPVANVSNNTTRSTGTNWGIKNISLEHGLFVIVAFHPL